MDDDLLALAAASYANTLGVGDSLTALPLRAVARLERLWQARDGEGDYRVASSHESLHACCDALAAGARIHLHAAVYSVSRDAYGRVTAACADGRHFVGAAAIIATPVPVLQPRRSSGAAVLRFSPPLPHDKIAAINSIQMKEALKVVLVFSPSPWADASDDSSDGCPKVHAILTAGAPGEVVPEMWFRHHHHHAAAADAPAAEVCGGGAWVVSGFATGAYAAALAQLGEARTIQLTLGQLRRVLPEHVASAHELPRRLRAAKVVDWSAAEHVYGGYSAPSLEEEDAGDAGDAAAGGRGGARALYRRPEWGGQLAFCGEATQEAMMTMSAAVESGRRAAEEVQSAGRLAAWEAADGTWQRVEARL